MDILRPNILRNAHLALSLYRPSTRTTAAALCISASQPWQPDASAPSAKVPVVLPRHLDDAVNSYLRGIKTKDLRALVDHFESLVYASLPRTANIRHLDPNRLTIPYDTPTYVKAYLAKRFVGSYSAITHVLQQLATRLPDYHPKHVLDVGAGPGTALWASSQFWTADAYTAVEPSRHMAHALQEISNAAYGTRIITIEPRLNTKIQADLVICAFVLTDIATQSSRAELIDSLWSSSTDILVLIESATPSGFKLIEDARAQILKKCTHGSIHVVAPCPHEFACPMSRTKSWCHFPRRYLPTAKMRALNPKSPDTLTSIKFSYCILRKSPPPPLTQRYPILNASPMKQKGHVTLDYCAPSGQLERAVISKKKGNYKAARKIQWGDVWSEEIVTKRVVKVVKEELHGRDANDDADKGKNVIASI
ncbi:hypothetical protein SeMB42_g04417 [Synchytrium endobioticum]|uniref:Ribosomal small subunit Rsm22 n=1 Tax=Synchytrium endobioticum TaxID=286115 RepID=A0A507CY96_9FUNG|nr:hypothetical protein SeLEV6574_g08231 [Synchytrium endobioticum]TPX44132.1 hypothetical protein SeMB42_g04417 [Synchytrium endobioticum]